MIEEPNEVSVLNVVGPDADEIVTHSTATRKGFGPGAAAFGLAVVVLVGLAGWWLTRPDAEVAEPIPTTSIPVPGDIDDRAENRVPIPVPDPGAVTDEDGGSLLPPSAAHLREELAAGVFAITLDTDNKTYGMAYLGADGPVIVDAKGFRTPEVELAVEFRQVSRFALFGTDGRTWAIDPRNRDESFLVSDNYSVVEMAAGGVVGIVEEGRDRIALLASSLAVPAVDLPAGAEVLMVQGRGVLVMPRTGGTFEVTGLAETLVKISDDTAVAASIGAAVFERCDDELQCELYLTRRSDEADIQLDIEGGASISVSPDGKALVDYGDGSTTMTDTETGATRDLGADRPIGVDWSPDGRFAALLYDGRVNIVFTANIADADDGSDVGFPLNDLATLNSLLVFSTELAP